VTGTFTCTNGYSLVNNGTQTAFGLTANDSFAGGAPMSVVAISRPGAAPSVGSYTWLSGDTGVDSGFEVDFPPPATDDYAVSANNEGMTNQGSYTMSIDIVAADVVSTATFYKAHGTIDATLLPDPEGGASGVVTMHVTF
jgi:hypothetical protein